MGHSLRSAVGKPRCRGVRSRGPAWFTLLAGALLALGGCGGRINRVLEFQTAPSAEAWAVDVDSFRGDVKVISDPQAPEIEIKAKLRAGFEWYRLNLNRRQYRLTQTLDNVNVMAELIRDESGRGVLQVTTMTEYHYPEIQSVDLIITMPDVRGVRVKTRDGAVDLVNIRGAVEVINESGDVMVRTLRPMREPVRITTTNGDIGYRIRAESTGLFDLDAPGGRVEFKALRGDVIMRQTGAEHATAELGEATNPVVLRAMDGEVRVTVKSNPVGVGPLNF